MTVDVVKTVVVPIGGLAGHVLVLRGVEEPMTTVGVK